MNDLTNAQLLILKNWIVANNNSLFDESAVAALNAAASPTFYIYRKNVPIREVMKNGFDWTRVDNLSVGKARIWDWMRNAYAANNVEALDPSGPDCRAGINAVWVGTSADLAVRAAIYLHCQQPATVAEKLLASGAGTTAAQDGSGPATCGVNAFGPVTLDIVVASESATA